jgi:hypothetical protein
VYPSFSYPYRLPAELPDQIQLLDHITGFGADLSNKVLAEINEYAQANHRIITVYYHSPLPKKALKELCPCLRFELSYEHTTRDLFDSFLTYNIHPELQPKNFLCSFNGSAHVSRKLLVAMLHRFGWYDPYYVTKNFQFTVAELDGHIADFADPEQHRFYRPFFIGPDSAEFFNSYNTITYRQRDHGHNLVSLEHQLTKSFVHLISETLATSYWPFVTEKVFYSIVTRGLFVAYAAPGWHQHLEHYYGFRRYDKIFDYSFDEITNPLERLLALLCMLSKFATLSESDRRDLYEMEVDTIEFNYNHYFSKDYVKILHERA